jgi:hypothetical protein
MNLSLLCRAQSLRVLSCYLPHTALAQASHPTAPLFLSRSWQALRAVVFRSMGISR